MFNVYVSILEKALLYQVLFGYLREIKALSMI